ncbi:TonB C-terminal domain-containing protein [Piscinibacter sp. HJYY11]|uniref:TonB C-terminal domain-containing protein n=1 Tax=Piscinibacter sp. HJYY11 TaxID=2801333 RepID=UPI0019200FCC|nr:TonB C-terminal domain-containing protein [Piscinibacter sp. HJYY11]MBL0726190.1 TonB C-terminal domain-containing protein [Piscinibacter sp. HJYY11]
MQDFDEPNGASGRLRGIVLIVAGLGLLAAAVWWLVGFLSTPAAKPRGVQQVALIKPPPPPPPPKPQEKPPEPPKVKEEVKVEAPKDEPKPAEKPADDKPASDKPLGVDADAAAGSDGFGLQASRGGRDLLTTGGGGAYYSGLLQRHFFEALSRNRKVLRDDFRVVVKVWIGDDGKVQKADIVTGSGNAQVDELIHLTLLDIAPLRDVPPSSMRPIQLRLSNRS